MASGPARETDWKCQAVRGVVKAMAPRLTARLDRTNRAARQPVLAQKPLGLAGSLAVHRSVRGPEKR